MSGPNAEGLSVGYGQPVSEQPAVPIVDFLRARYDEIEAAAKAAGGESWLYHVDHPDEVLARTHGYAIRIDTHEAGLSQHILRNDPAYVLADIAAKRKIVETLAREDDCGCDAFNHHDHEPVLRLLAAPFRAHPDFDPAWTVDP